MPSNKFQQEVGQFLTKKFKVSYRLADAAYNRYGQRSVSSKPYDFFGSTETGIIWASEAKKVKSIRFPFTNIYPHQHSSLELIESVGGFAWLFINWRLTKGGRAIWIPHFEFVQLKIDSEKEGRKSIRCDSVPEQWFLNRIRGGWEVPTTHPLAWLK